MDKSSGKNRNKVLKEIEIFHHCKGHENILQLVEYFEEEEKFYLVFEKMEGGVHFSVYLVTNFTIIKSQIKTLNG